MRLGVIGASGFIGLRICEILRDAGHEVRPVVRSPSSLAVLARAVYDWRIADLGKEDELSSALEGCDRCIHAAIGDARQIIGMAEATYNACCRTGIERLIWLSSAAVHGQSPDRNTVEESPLSSNHELEYNNAKVLAERVLSGKCSSGKTKVTVLRPSIVYGPRSTWISRVGERIQGGEAVWPNDGGGICNAVYVDNLVEAIRLSALFEKERMAIYFVRDVEEVRWRQVLLPIAQAFGYGEEILTQRQNYVIQYENTRSAAIGERFPALAGCVPVRIKSALKAAHSALLAPKVHANVWTLPIDNLVKLPSELVDLASCEWQMPINRLQTALGYSPPVLFSEGIKRSVAWLKTVTYPFCFDVA